MGVKVPSSGNLQVNPILDENTISSSNTLSLPQFAITALPDDRSIHPINLLTHIDGLPLSFALSIFTLLVVVWCMVTHDGIGYEMIKVVKLLLCEHLSVLLLR